eukprot:CAMPEP_0175060796 /NCGR_PEP_ID=MMETSP0052_2-20121109/13228_1 /TAXON_ID=51329 ORGANISM="Polytomella parva, Strain SAG 63-3" /NCGR_SAMPLE_ID=MMETSP0052_2 /ASSEMBLY_ACC=CAM_ASM_000194 /LENGTH=99 /DNA_ID=CAMNT_0016326579 /DNA_START=231 /DNA_END=527 /DNA_ORIENTATION=+
MAPPFPSDVLREAPLIRPPSQPKPYPALSHPPIGAASTEWQWALTSEGTYAYVAIPSSFPPPSLPPPPLPPPPLPPPPLPLAATYSPRKPSYSNSPRCP